MQQSSFLPTRILLKKKGTATRWGGGEPLKTLTAKYHHSLAYSDALLNTLNKINFLLLTVYVLSAVKSLPDYGGHMN